MLEGLSMCAIFREKLSLKFKSRKHAAFIKMMMIILRQFVVVKCFFIYFAHCIVGK